MWVILSTRRTVRSLVRSISAGRDPAVISPHEYINSVLPSISLEQNEGKCGKIDLRDEMEDPVGEIRTRQLLGLDLGRK